MKGKKTEKILAQFSKACFGNDNDIPNLMIVFNASVKAAARLWAEKGAAEAGRAVCFGCARVRRKGAAAAGVHGGGEKGAFPFKRRGRKKAVHRGAGMPGQGSHPEKTPAPPGQAPGGRRKGRRRKGWENTGTYDGKYEEGYTAYAQEKDRG